MNYKYLVLGFIVAILIGVYGFLDPSDHRYFPKCPIFFSTGLQCPGCGSQRAIHQLLQGNIVQSIAFNPLVIIFLPYILIGWMAQILKGLPLMESIRLRFYGVYAAYTILAIVIIFTIVRNIA